MSKDKAEYRHIYTQRNPMYEQGLVELSLRACLKNNNAEIREGQNTHFEVETIPKWYTKLRKVPITDFGDLNHKEATIYNTDSLKSARGRVMKRVFDMSDHYQPLYAEKEVSMIMHTLTTANDVYIRKGQTMRKAMDSIKYRYSSIGMPIRGYVWVSEVSEDFHWHYHLLVASERFEIKGQKMPKELKLDDVWGAHTKVEFIRKNLRSYLSGYFSKSNWRVRGQRRVGQSKKWK